MSSTVIKENTTDVQQLQLQQLQQRDFEGRKVTWEYALPSFQILALFSQPSLTRTLKKHGRERTELG